MALIRNSRAQKVSGGYARLFGNKQLGTLVSRVHSAVISSGTELERMIKERATPIPDIDEFLKQDPFASGVFLVNKQQIKNSEVFRFHGAEPDFVIFVRDGRKQTCHIVELKDGDAFDTKKAEAEHRTALKFVSENAHNLPCTVSVHFCCFNQDSREEIVRGFKNKINVEEAMTGREFCELLQLDYDEIVKERAKQVSDNLPYFLSELVKISAVRNWLKKHFG